MAVCRFFLQGRCLKGRSCPFSHDVSAASPTSALPEIQSLAINQDSAPHIQHDSASPIPCRFFQSGSCRWGGKCSFAHVLKIPEVGDMLQTSSETTYETSTPVLADTRHLLPCKYFQQGNCRNGANCPFSHSKDTTAGSELEASLEVNNPKDRDDFSREFFGAFAQFKDGGRISNISLPMDFSSIRMSGLPLDSTPASVSSLIKTFNFEVLPQYIRVLRSGGKTSALVRVEDPLFARAFCEKLKSDSHGSAFEAQPISATTSGSTRRVSCKKVHVSWFKPTRPVWLNFGSKDIASRVGERFNSGLYKVLNQKVMASLPKHSPSHGPQFGRNRNPVSWSITLNNVPSHATEPDIEGAIYSKQDKPRHCELGKPGTYMDPETTAVFVESLFANLGPNEFHFDAQSHGKRFKAIARFEEEFDARESVRRLHDQPQEFLHKSKLTVQLISSAKFKISTVIYDALSDQLSKEAKIWRESHLQYKVYRNTDPLQRFTTLKLEGENTKDVSVAADLLERTIAGKVIEEKGLPIWNTVLSSNGVTYRLVKQIEQEQGVLLIRNKAKKNLKFFGPVDKYQKIREAVVNIVKSESITTHTIELDPDTFLWACNEIYSRIVSTFGDDAVSFDEASRPQRILITGTEEQYLSALAIIKGMKKDIQKSDAEETNQDCTVCWTEAENPILTTCNHIYCLECFGDMSVAAGSQNQEFSIDCQGDMGKCGKVFTLAELQDHLSSNTFEEILEASFTSHLRRHPQDFRYCQTPDCGYIYRATISAAAYTCQKCLEVICTACDGQHSAMTCADYKDLKSGGTEAFERYKKEKGIKDCPICKTPIEKTEGCNHMTCGGCRAHICWVCLKTFKESGACYDHMTKTHGSIGLEDLQDGW